MLRTELLMLIAVSFAGLNMGNYPPGPQSGLAQACHGFLAAQAKPATARWAALRAFLGGSDVAMGDRSGAGRAHVDERLRRQPAACFNMSTTLPATAAHGGEGTFSCGDWSGCGAGANGLAYASPFTHPPSRRSASPVLPLLSGPRTSAHRGSTAVPPPPPGAISSAHAMAVERRRALVWRRKATPLS